MMKICLHQPGSATLALLLASGMLALATPASSTPASVFAPAESLARSQLVTPVTGRKGTRNYRSDGSSTSEPATTKNDDKIDSMKLCMDTWDEGTHITRTKWREICTRQLKDRDSMRAP